ncbi:putative laccase-19, partial [Dichanthelium oligosanthes]
LMNCWADGVPMITQLPILPNHNFTYRFDVSGQEGSQWWHAHVPCLRTTVHGILIIRSRHGAVLYPFPQPHQEIPVIIGSSSEYYLEIAGHKFTVLATDANYVSPYTTDIITIAPGQTVDALWSPMPLLADTTWSPCPTSHQSPTFRVRSWSVEARCSISTTTGPAMANQCQAQISEEEEGAGEGPSSDVPMALEMPDNHDTMISFYFHGNLTSLHHPRHLPVPEQIDERLFITLGLGSVCQQGQSCKRGDSHDNIVVATMNNVSYQLPAVSTPLLEAHYYNTDSMDWLQELPDMPPRVFNFTDHSLIPTGPKEAQLEPTSKAAFTTTEQAITANHFIAGLLRPSSDRRTRPVKSLNRQWYKESLPAKPKPAVIHRISAGSDINRQ